MREQIEVELLLLRLAFPYNALLGNAQARVYRSGDRIAFVDDKKACSCNLLHILQVRLTCEPYSYFIPQVGWVLHTYRYGRNGSLLWSYTLTASVITVILHTIPRLRQKHTSQWMQARFAASVESCKMPEKRHTRYEAHRKNMFAPHVAR